MLRRTGLKSRDPSVTKISRPSRLVRTQKHAKAAEPARSSAVTIDPSAQSLRRPIALLGLCGQGQPTTRRTI
jgi:hypothetical protein